MLKNTHCIQTSINIRAPKEVVWKAIVDFDSYHLWNSFIPKARGHALPGEKIEMTIHVPGESPQKYQVQIKESLQDEKLTWLGHFKFRGLIDGYHSFDLVSVDHSSTELKHNEYFSGILVPLVWKSFLTTKLRQGLLTLNQDLKEYLERS